MAEEDTWEKAENLENAQEALKDYKRGYEEMARRIMEEEDGAYSRSELPGRYMAKLLYGWDNENSNEFSLSTQTLLSFFPSFLCIHILFAASLMQRMQGLIKYEEKKMHIYVEVDHRSEDKRPKMTNLIPSHGTISVSGLRLK